MAAARVATKKPQPRAIVALSDDRQWLVVQTTDSNDTYWKIYERAQTVDVYEAWGDMPGEGMTAEEVLAAHLELV
jgi:hypothetical protein